MRQIQRVGGRAINSKVTSATTSLTETKKARRTQNLNYRSKKETKNSKKKKDAKNTREECQI